MAVRSPTLEGFRLMFTRPAVGMAEIAWRWSLGFAAAAVLTACVVEYLRTLAVTTADMLFLRSRQPALISQAVAHIFRGSAPRLVEALVVVCIALSLAWIVIGAVGRGATIRALLEEFGSTGDAGSESARRFWPGAGESWRLRSLVGLNFLRMALGIAAIAGCLGALLIGAAASPDRDPSPGSAFAIFLLIGMMVCIAWSVVNWFLSVAPVFVVGEGRDTFGSIGASVRLCRNHAGSVFAAGSWFGLAHIVAFFIATSIVAFPFAFIGVLPGPVVFGGVLCITLMYFAVVDFLYVGRLGAYVAILAQPDIVTPPHVPPPVMLTPSGPAGSTIPASASVDKSETILSDAEQQTARREQDSAEQNLKPFTTEDTKDKEDR